MASDANSTMTAAATAAPRAPDIPAPIRPGRRPRTRLPLGATDCHAHVFGPQRRYPLLPATHFVPHECPLADYVAMLRHIGCDRAVLVQPSVYGTNNAAIEHALRERAIDLRAIAVVAPDVSDNELLRLHELGFRGVRINTASGTKGLQLADAPRLAERLAPLGWHLQFYANFREQPEVEEALARLRIPIVIDHFGRLRTEEGVQAPAFQAVLRLLRQENCHAKLMGPYFVSPGFPAYADLLPFARAMIEAAPDRVVWGSDWPHASARECMPDDADLVDLLADWAGDEATLHRIVVTNPERLYGFAPM